jgi:hypothetical protein
LPLTRHNELHRSRGPCEHLALDGFGGVEGGEQIVNWMLKKPFSQEVKWQLFIGSTGSKTSKIQVGQEQKPVEKVC